MTELWCKWRLEIRRDTAIVVEKMAELCFHGGANMHQWLEMMAQGADSFTVCKKIEDGGVAVAPARVAAAVEGGHGG